MIGVGKTDIAKREQRAWRLASPSQGFRRIYEVQTMLYARSENDRELTGGD